MLDCEVCIKMFFHVHSVHQSAIIYTIADGVCNAVLVIRHYFTHTIRYDTNRGAPIAKISRNRGPRSLGKLEGAMVRRSVSCTDLGNSSPAVFQITLFRSPYKVFLQFLYLWKVLIKNPDDATLASLGILSNMQIKAAITEIPFFVHSSLQTWDKMMKMVSTPRFSGSIILIRPLPKWSNNLHMHKYAN